MQVLDLTNWGFNAFLLFTILRFLHKSLPFMAEDGVVLATERKWKLPIFVFFKDLRYFILMVHELIKNYFVCCSRKVKYHFIELICGFSIRNQLIPYRSCYIWSYETVLQACPRVGLTWKGNTSYCCTCSHGISRWSCCFFNWHRLHWSYRYVFFR